MIIRKPKGRVANKRKYESLLDLPDDLWENILMRLAAIERLTIAQQVCTTWRRVLKEPTMWHVIDMSDVRGLPDSKVVQHVCREGVDRSQGELVDIRIDFFATKELLVYVANRGFDGVLGVLEGARIFFGEKRMNNDVNNAFGALIICYGRVRVKERTLFPLNAKTEPGK
ncbi:F-box protein SKIP19 [Capsicum annuum]|uniref:F-box protein SKIP19 n=2 Tax=Capsicum annuum TaxID=4072 RepID=A0A2G3ANC2_CAPAN|nr:F-box protein SKIP19 [Capsicum annuum]